MTFCRVNVGNIRSSKIGIHLITSNTENMEPIYYNEIHYSDIIASETGFCVEAIGYYINENRYYGGTIGGGCVKGVKLWSQGTIDGGGYTTGANKFLSGGIEGIADDGCALYMENTTGNIFSNIRCAERYGKNSVVLVGQTYDNTVEFSAFNLEEVDISGLGDIKARYTTLRATAGRNTADGKIAGIEARASSRYGITYNPAEANNAWVDIKSTTFLTNVIDRVGAMIPIALSLNDAALNGKTFTLGYLFSGAASLAQGAPVVFQLAPGGGRIKIIDYNGGEIFDNTGGSLDGKTLSVRWAGYDSNYAKNIWDVIVLDRVMLSEDDLQAAIDAALAQAKESGEFDGMDGTNGVDGVGVASVEQTTESSEDGGKNIVTVTLTNGTKSTFAVKNGSKGSDGAPGADGATPVKGTDYFTDADIQTIVNAVYVKIADGNGVAY